MGRAFRAAGRSGGEDASVILTARGGEELFRVVKPSVRAPSSHGVFVRRGFGIPLRDDGGEPDERVEPIYGAKDDAEYIEEKVKMPYMPDLMPQSE